MNLIKLTINSFRANRNRTFLTMLGIIIGIGAVIVIMSVGAGAQSLIFDQINSIGSNLIGIMPGYSEEEGPPASVMGIALTNLKNGDAEALKKIKHVDGVSAYVRGIESVTWQNQKVDVTYVGTTSSYPVVESAKIEKGYFFDASSDNGISREVVLGWQVSQDLFGNEDPLGKNIKIKKESFRVIGVIEKRGVRGFENQDQLVFIPLETAQKILLGINHVSLIRVLVNSEENIPMVLQEVNSILRERHGITGSNPNDFTARAAIQALDALKEVTDALKFFLAGIAAISLVVGGVGIMNIMLIAVNERTREIGLRKAVGATSANIQYQFLVEALVLTISGGLLGIIGGSLISGLIALIANYLGYNWDFVVTLSSIIVGVVFAGCVGLIFGWYPARRAADLQPIEALRHE